MIRRPPRSTRTDTLFPYTTLFRSVAATTIGPFVQHGLTQRDIDLLQCHHRPGLLLFFQTKEAIRQADTLHRARLPTLARGSTYFINPTTTYSTVLLRLPKQSEEASVGQEFVSTGRSRWSADY